MALEHVRTCVEKWIAANAPLVDAVVLTDHVAASVMVQLSHRSTGRSGSVLVDDDLSVIFTVENERLEFGSLGATSLTDEVAAFLAAFRDPHIVRDRWRRTWMTWDAAAGRRRLRIRRTNG